MTDVVSSFEAAQFFTAPRTTCGDWRVKVDCAL